MSEYRRLTTNLTWATNRETRQTKAISGSRRSIVDADRSAINCGYNWCHSISSDDWHA